MHRPYGHSLYRYLNPKTVWRKRGLCLVVHLHFGVPFCQNGYRDMTNSGKGRMATTQDMLDSGDGPGTAGGGSGKGWSADHSVDARYRFPWFGGPVYVRFILGRERRPPDRIREHNAGSIGRSVVNVLMFALGACVLYTAAAAVLLAFSSVLE